MSTLTSAKQACAHDLLQYFHGICILFRPKHFDKNSIDVNDVLEMMEITGNSSNATLPYLELLEKESNRWDSFEAFLEFLRENKHMFRDEPDAEEQKAESERTKEASMQDFMTLSYSAFGAYYDGLDREDKQKMVRMFNCITVREGDKVIEQGEVATFALILLSGALGCMDKARSDSFAMPVARGEILGGGGYFKQTVRPFDVVAAKASTLLLISYKQLSSLQDTAADASLRAKVVTMLGRAAIADLSRQLNSALDRTETIVPPTVERKPELLFRQLQIEDEISFSNDDDDFILEDEAQESKKPVVAISERRATKIQAESRNLESKIHELTQKVTRLTKENEELKLEVQESRDEVSLGLSLKSETPQPTKTEPSGHKRGNSISLSGKALSDRIESLPPDLQLWIKNFQDQYHLLRTQLNETSQVLDHYKHRWEQSVKEYETDMAGIARQREGFEETIRELKKNNQSYAMLVKFISVQNYVKSWRMRNFLRAVFSRAVRVSSNIMLALLDGKEDVPSNQQDDYESLITRASRLTKMYPWSKKRKVPFHIMIKHLDVEVALVETKSGELIDQKRKWKETSESFFKRTLELRKEFVDRKEDTEAVDEKIASLQGDIAERDETIVKLEQQLESERVAKHHVSVDGDQQRSQKDMKTVRKEARDLFDRTVFLKRRVVQLESHLESLENQKANTDRDIQELHEKRRGEEAALRASRRAAETSSQALANGSTGYASQEDLMPGWNFSSQVDRSTEKHMRLRTTGIVASRGPPRAPPSNTNGANKSGSQTARTYRWRAAKPQNSQNVDLSEMVLPEVQPLFKVRYKHPGSRTDRRRL